MFSDLSPFCPQLLARCYSRDKWIWLQGLTRLTAFTSTPEAESTYTGQILQFRIKCILVYFLKSGKVTEFISKSLCFKFGPGVSDFIFSAHELPSRNMYRASSSFLSSLFFILLPFPQVLLEAHHAYHSAAFSCVSLSNFFFTYFHELLLISVFSLPLHPFYLVSNALLVLATYSYLFHQFFPSMMNNTYITLSYSDSTRFAPLAQKMANLVDILRFITCLHIYIL
jgi:hypothetical protein